MINPFFARMNTHQILKHFFSELTSFYSKNELVSIWNLCLDFVLKMNRNIFITNPKDEVDKEKVIIINNTIDRLKNHEPIQYITGKVWFCDSIFNVNPAVLIPRPETEELVYKICEYIDQSSFHVLDIGTGSGCIAISIKKLKPKTTATGIDISEAALEIAANNAAQILDDTSVSFINRDVLNPDFYKYFKNKFDIIVSNPPYIPEIEKETLHENVLNFEPHIALFCGIDPMLFYKAIATHAKHLLKPNGLLFFEIHENFGQGVEEILRNEYFNEIEIIQDLQGKNRIVKSRI